jgi:hypothetical protein
LWPHLAKSFLPYLLSGSVLAVLFEILKRINARLEFEKLKQRVGKILRGEM